MKHRSIRLLFMAVVAVTVLALAGCPTAIQSPPAVSFVTEQPMIEIPELTEGDAMSSVTLPLAIDGSGELTYSLRPEVPGLTFAASTRVLSGTPTAAGSYSMTYTAADTADGTASLSFTITVQAAPPPLMIDPAPTAAAVANGTYLAAVLGGDANDALTVDGAAALAEDVFTDDHVAALLAADWWKTPAEVALASPAFGALVAALVPVYDKHLVPAVHTVTLRETVMPDGDDPIIPAIDLTTLSLGAAHVGSLASQPSVGQTESCYLSVNEFAALDAGDPAVAQRIGACVTFSGSSLSAMQAVEVARTCAIGGCSGEAARPVLAAIGATVLHGLLDSMAVQLTDMIIAEWLMGWYVSLIDWEDDDGDAIGEFHAYALMHIREDSARYLLEENGEVEVDMELGPWTHHRTSIGGEFVGADGRLHYQYVGYRLHALRGGVPPDDTLWMARIGDELVGTWSGMRDDDTYTLNIDRRGAVELTVSGQAKRGWIEHDQHFEEGRRGDYTLDDSGVPGDQRVRRTRNDVPGRWRVADVELLPRRRSHRNGRPSATV